MSTATRARLEARAQPPLRPWPRSQPRSTSMPTATAVDIRISSSSAGSRPLRIYGARSERRSELPPAYVWTAFRPRPDCGMLFSLKLSDPTAPAYTLIFHPLVAILIAFHLLLAGSAYKNARKPTSATLSPLPFLHSGWDFLGGGGMERVVIR